MSRLSRDPLSALGDAIFSVDKKLTKEQIARHGPGEFSTDRYGQILLSKGQGGRDVLTGSAFNIFGDSPSGLEGLDNVPKPYHGPSGDYSLSKDPLGEGPLDQDPLDIGGTFTDTPTDTNVGGVGELDTPDQSHPDQQETRSTDASRGRDPRATDRKMEDLDLDGNNYRAWAQGAALALEGLTDIVNARMRADRAAHQARINISIAQRRANTAITQSLTRSARLKRKGQHDAEKLKAYMAAQGQNVTGDFVQQAAAAHEMQGINEGMIEEINGIRNALGFKEQIIVQEMTAASAKIQRDLDTIMGIQKIGAGTILIAGS